MPTEITSGGPGTGTTDGETSSQPVDQRIAETLLDLLKTANNPAAIEAQTILLRRLALQGDVVASRVPAPRNITEIGGYINLLSTLDHPDMRTQLLAGILGVAGPNPPPGWTAVQPPLLFASLPNDRPAGPAQASIPLSFAVRSDFIAPLQAALATLHDLGAALPLVANAYVLPPASPGATTAIDPLPYLGRVVQIVPSTALRDPATDPMALARAAGSASAFEIVARATPAAGAGPGTGSGPGTGPGGSSGGGSGTGSPGSGPGGGTSPGPGSGPGGGPVAPGGGIAAVPWDALQCTAAACTPVSVTAAFVPIAPILATAGFYPATPLPQPTSLAAHAWGRLTNTTGLIAGMTRLGDELHLLYRTTDVAASAFAARLHWLWDGAAFVQP